MTRTVVVLAGGLGQRVAHLTGPDLPKALLPIDGRPFLDVKLAELVAEGADEIVLLIGHKGEQLVRHVEAAGPFGATVRCIVDGPQLLGTGGAIQRALPDLPERFWVTYGDTLLDVPMEAVERHRETSAAESLMTVLENADRWETSNVSVRDGLVVAYEKGAPPGSHRFIDYGMLLLTQDAFDAPRPEAPFDLREIVHGEIDRGRLGAWIVTDRFHEIGTEVAWRETDEWMRESRHWARLQERIRERG